MNHLSRFEDQEREDEYFSEAEEVNDQIDCDDNNKHQEDSAKNKVKIKNIVRKPQPKLDPTRLCGERGLKCLLENFENFKSKGNGLEYRDLDIMLSKFEFWAHRLFPKMKFYDVIEKLEKLGEKREVKSAVYNIRRGLTNRFENNFDQNDPNVQDELMTARVMDMMNKITNLNNSIENENDKNEVNFNRLSDNLVFDIKNKRVAEDDEEDDELIRNTNFDNIYGTLSFQSASAL